jgi:SseB protein C-terminal domain
VQAPAGTRIFIGAPANPPPEELVDRLRKRCDTHPEIAAAYLFQTLMVLKGERPHLALGLVFAEAPTPARLRAIADDLGEHSYPLRPEDEFLEIQTLDESKLASVAGAVAPFFERR